MESPEYESNMESSELVGERKLERDTLIKRRVLVDSKAKDG